MPLLGLFSKKGRTPSKSSSTASKAGASVSNFSLEDDDYVAVAAPPRPSVYPSHAPPASSSRLALPFRRKGGAAPLEQKPELSYSDPLLDPPPRRSSLFQTYQDDHTAYRSTQSLPDDTERRPPRPQANPQQKAQHGSSQSAKKSMFKWGSSKESSKSVPSTDDQASFNLKSFRHVRPDSPASPRSSASLPPVPTPIVTNTMPTPPVSFQVTSRPRGNSVSELAATSSQQLAIQTSQQKMAAGAFRQAARRSSTSLSLTDSPVLSPTRASLDDRPPPSLLLPSPARPETPTRPPRSQPPPHGASPSAPKPSATSNPTLRKRTNAFTASSSSSSSSSEEDDDSDSTDGVGPSGLSRKTTIRANQPRAATLPPISASVREQIQRATPPGSSLNSSSSANDASRVQSSLGVYGPGARPRASLSAGALSPSAKEARASAAVMANARLMNAPRPPSKVSQARTVGSDTSESAPSGSDSDEDAPLSSLVPPRRPGTSLSAHSAPATPRKLSQPLVDLDAPSTLTGRPVKAPPPLARDMDADPRQKSRISLEVGARSRTSQPSSPPTSRMSQAASPQSSRMSQLSAPSRTLVNLDTSAAPNTGRPVALSPGGGRQSIMSQGSPRTIPSSTSNLVDPPLRPFARRESPASSTGDSSSGKAPLTPRDGSDYGGVKSAYSGPSSASVGRGRPGARGHGRKPSVTFEDEKESNRKGKSRERDNVSPQEQRRRERRRSEARAAIELGNVVNGPPPKDEDDEALGQHPGLQPGWPQQGLQMPMQIPMPPVPSMFNMNMGMPSPGAFGFSAPSPGADPAFLAAHQQAMAIAKQTFQYAVAQQALAAANDEWERSSTATGFGGGGQQWGGYGMGMGMGMGMGGARMSTMYTPPAARSMYAGSVGGGGNGWGGTGSVYGDAFGPAAAGTRNSTYSQVDLSSGAQQRHPRPRTKTAPSSASPPTGSSGRMPAPPSSFRAPGY